MLTTLGSTLAVVTGHAGGNVEGRSPLGKYAAIGALIVAVGTIAAAVAYRIIHPGSSDPTLDGWAYLSIGVVLGTTAGVYGGREEGQTAAAKTINGLAGKVDALHRRMDTTPAGPTSPAPIAIATTGPQLTPAELESLRQLLAQASTTSTEGPSTT